MASYRQLLERATRARLEQYAKAQQVEVRPEMTKAEIVAAVLATVQERRKVAVK